MRYLGKDPKESILRGSDESVLAGQEHVGTWVSTWVLVNSLYQVGGRHIRKYVEAHLIAKGPQS